MNRIANAALIASLAFVLTACGGQGASSSTQAEGTATTEATETTTTDTKQTDTGTATEAAGNETASTTAEGAERYVGTWASDRAILEIGPEDAGYKCHIHWGGSVDEATEWYYSCMYDGQSLVDEGVGVKTTVVYDENGEITGSLDEFNDGSAKFELNEDGTLTWTDFKEYPDGENGGVTVFVRVA